MLAALWTLKLSSTTTCPGRRVGAHCSRMYHSNVAVSIAPSISHGTCRPSGASAATSDVFLPWVRGTDPLARWSCGAPPYRRVQDVWVPLSSTKTSGGGSRVATAARQAARSCSSRSARLPVTFCLRPAQPADRPPHRRLT
jgi:hypothetical protein